LLLLLPVDFFSPPWLLRLLLPLPLPLAALEPEPSLEALARSPLAGAEDADEEALLPPLEPDLPDEDEDFELPDFMGISFG
jgi:hypothetical protein